MMTTLPISDTHDVAVKRMEWRCRRGMLEMDLLFVQIQFDLRKGIIEIIIYSF